MRSCLLLQRWSGGSRPCSVLRFGWYPSTLCRRPTGPLAGGPAAVCSKRLSEIRVPTLVVAGAKDAPDARANYDNSAKGIPNAKKVVFPNAAHLVNIDMPQEFNQTVLEFLSKR